MKFFIILAVALVSAHADVSHIVKSGGDEASASVVRSGYDISPEGAFQYEYETSNGISGQADGVVKNGNSDNPALEIKGGVRYTAPDGSPIDLSYIANENGYQPQGSHIPVPPPIPEAIQRSLDYIAAHPPPVDRKFV
ncbi:larval cuticle protein LCP-17-like [Achroia grisella]|uniref:larval cuticle protein LCP-17-like n=1 Tax=Achroia grisella TaxID=688607 RepID=UPI0027D2A506|nr:larval cuticle protein LCP-17-like [Achroia grisella]